MYQEFFEFSEPPFAIVPNPKFFFLSERHKEALSHMLAGIAAGGGMALLIGEVGTGKTMTMRALLARLPTHSQVLTIVNPSLNELEMLQTICDGFELPYKEADSFKLLLDKITDKLYSNEAKGIDTILLIDEAQHLTTEVLELLRLLTNIETAECKLLKVILIGQPELHQILQKENLRQLAQRITERYQLMPLPENELRQYIQHRLTCVGKLDPLFEEACYRIFAAHTEGVPRLINLVCDQALKIAYREGKRYISADIAKQACERVLDWQEKDKTTASLPKRVKYKPYYLGAIGALSVIAVASVLTLMIRSLLHSQSLIDEEIAKLNSESIPALSAKAAASADLVTRSANETLTDRVKTISLDNIAMQSMSLGSAIQNLYRQWGYRADEQAVSCQTEVRAELSCYRGILQFNQLVNINRPAVLIMNGVDGRRWYALFYAVGDDQIELIAGRHKQRFLVNEEFIQQYWSGEAITLWRPPFGNSNVLAKGQRNTRVRWLDERLNMALGEFDDPQNHFDQYVKNKVITFQIQQNIDADGIAGPLTIMMLDGVLGLAGPTLKLSV